MRQPGARFGGLGAWSCRAFEAQLRSTCSARELCLLLDAYATARCHAGSPGDESEVESQVHSLLLAITLETLRRLEEPGP